MEPLDIINRYLRRDLSVVRLRVENLPEEFPECDIIIAPALREIRFCFVHGLDWAVVLLSSALLEYCVKDRAWNIDNRDKNWDGKARREYFEETTFAKAIGKCREKGIISQEEHDQLEEIRKTVRNVTAHMNTVGLVKDKLASGLTKIHSDTGLVVPLGGGKASEDPIATKIAFWQEVNRISTELVEDVHALVRSMYKDAIERFKKGELGGIICYY